MYCSVYFKKKSDHQTSYYEAKQALKRFYMQSYTYLMKYQEFVDKTLGDSDLGCI
jgi:hypothetical protein